MTPLPSFSPEEISLLVNYQPKTQYILIRETYSNGECPIEIIAKNSITCWQKFLRLFNCGTLAHKKIHLIDVCAYLAQHEMHSLKLDWAKEPSSEKGIAYFKLCALAQKEEQKKASSFFIEKEWSGLFYQVILSKINPNIEGWKNPISLAADELPDYVEAVKEKASKGWPLTLPTKGLGLVRVVRISL